MAGEKNFENRVKRWLKENNIWYVKIWGGGFQRAGIPDILICARGKFVAVELKAENGVVSELQAREIEKIKESGGEAVVLYPKDWDNFKTYLLQLISNV